MSAAEIVQLNVGGTYHTTAQSTLAGCEPGSMLHSMFSGQWAPGSTDDDGRVFIDRDGELFRHVLNFLRTGQVYVETDAQCCALHAEAMYYGLMEMANLLQSISEERANERMLAEAREKEQRHAVQMDGEKLGRTLSQIILAGNGGGKGSATGVREGPVRGSGGPGSSIAAHLHTHNGGGINLPATLLGLPSPTARAANDTSAPFGVPPPSPSPQMSPSHFAADAEF
eukprot:COSAG01_NODE_34_length_34978_cov_45.798475_36_plen_227_part_00